MTALTRFSLASAALGFALVLGQVETGAAPLSVIPEGQQMVSPDLNTDNQNDEQNSVVVDDGPRNHESFIDPSGIFGNRQSPFLEDEPIARQPLGIDTPCKSGC